MKNSNRASLPCQVLRFWGWASILDHSSGRRIKKKRLTSDAHVDVAKEGGKDLQCAQGCCDVVCSDHLYSMKFCKDIGEMVLCLPVSFFPHLLYLCQRALSTPISFPTPFASVPVKVFHCSTNTDLLSCILHVYALFIFTYHKK